MKNTKVVIVGGGFGGLEVASYLLYKLTKKVDITLVSDKDYFLFKPNTIYIPFGKDPKELMFSYLDAAKKLGVNFLKATLLDVDPSKQKVYVDEKTLDYDYLVIAVGAKMTPEEISGLSEYANTIWTPEEMLKLRESINKLIDGAKEGKRQEVLFLVPPNNKCSGPLYEIVFMLDTYLRKKNVRDMVNIVYTTYERSFIQAFGPRLHNLVSQEFEKRKITGYTEYVVEKVEPKEVKYKNGKSLPFDLLISFPPYFSSVKLSNLKTDERGFIKTKFDTRQTVDYPNIYAVGDVGDFPVKQAFLALLQGDTVAEHLYSEIEKKNFKSFFIPTSMCIMEQFDKATFAKVPLELTQLSEQPVRVKESEMENYRVGSSGIWRLGKKLLGMYLPWRFRNLRPFHAGTPWSVMEFGLNIMVKLFTS
ncbi:MAG: FAD-dependent oxidoreductase [Candidatus Hydrothermales bacterium]